MQQAIRLQTVIQNQAHLIDENDSTKQAEENIQYVKPDDITLITQHHTQAAA